MMIIDCLNLGSELGFRLVCPVPKDIKVHTADRIKLIKFYKSKVGQAIYSFEVHLIEPLIGHIKSALQDRSITCPEDMIEHVQCVLLSVLLVSNTCILQL